jgi:hypothetical protein
MPGAETGFVFECEDTLRLCDLRHLDAFVARVVADHELHNERGEELNASYS